jgi:hypothetical protein
MSTPGVGQRRIPASILQAGAAFLLATLLVAPFFLSRRVPNPNGPGLRAVPNTHDMAVHLATLEEFDKGIRAGNWYPRWQAGFDYGYGLPYLNFYQPGFYFLGEVVNLGLGDWIAALFAISIWSMAASGLTFYAFARLFYSPVPSALGALFYMMAPYHLLNLYHRGAMPEFVGILFVPVVFHMAFLVGTYGRARHYAGLGFFYGLCLVTHFPTAYLLSFVLAVYVLIWAFTERNWRIVARVAAGTGLGLLLSAIYLLPASLESRFMEEYWTTLFRYHQNYLPTWPAKDVMASLLDQSFALQTVGLLLAIALLWIVAPAPVAGVAGKAQSPGAHTRFLMITGVVATFMATPLSFYVSRLLPKIEVLMFPWRWLLFMTFCGAMGAAAVLERLRSRVPASSKMLAAYRVGIAVVILWNGWTAIHSVVLGAFSNPNLRRLAVFEVGNLFPKGAYPPSMLMNTPEAVLVSGGGIVKVLRWEPVYREVLVVLEKESVLRLKSYNFPGWVGTVNDQPATIQTGPDGAQILALPAGRFQVAVSFVNTPPRTAGAAISGLAFCVICGLIFFDIRRRGPIRDGAQPEERFG